MTYDPNVAPHAWQPAPRPQMAKTAAGASPIDGVRVARLAILVGLVGFWTVVVMAVF